MAVYINKEFPFQVKDVETEVAEDIMEKFTGIKSGLVRVGPKGYLFPKRYESEAALYFNMRVRPSDVFVVTFPRSGTTLTQELVWLIENDLDFKKASEVALAERFPFLEHSVSFDPVTLQHIMEDNNGNEEVLETLRTMNTPATERLVHAPSPRFVKSHLPLSLLPPALLDTARVIYVARDPRDVAVSYFYQQKIFRLRGYVGDFKTFWNYFINGLIIWSPFFESIKEAWQRRHHPNMLFLFYEELTKNQPAAIEKIAMFLNKQLTEEQVTQLVEHVKIENFKKNSAVNENYFGKIGILVPGGEHDFIREGKAGGWREHFDEEMARQAERWIADNLRGTDLRFPDNYD